MPARESERGTTPCAFCKRPIPLTEAQVIIDQFFGLRFCDDECADAWQAERNDA